MHQVRYFLSMARLLNFTRAADACNVTQPSLTKAIQKLEDEFGGPLFRRERSRTHLTDLGRLMLPHLERTLEAAQTAKALARNIGKAEVAPLALGVAGSIETATLDAVLADLGRSLPGFDLTVTSGTSAELLEQALAGELDLLIAEAPDDAPERLESWPLFAHVYHMVTRPDHPATALAAPTLAACRDESWIAFGDGPARLREAAAAHGFEPELRHRATDVAQLMRMIAAGLGSGFLPGPRDDPRLRSIRLVDAAVARDVVLAAIAGRRRSVAADAFVRASRAVGWETMAIV